MKEENQFHRVTLCPLHVQNYVYPNALKIINEKFKIIKQIDKCFLKTIFFPLPSAAYSPNTLRKKTKDGKFETSLS